MSVYNTADIMQIQFFNTQEFMRAIDATADEILPSGFTIIYELPPLPAKQIEEKV